MKDNAPLEPPVIILGFRLRPEHLARLREIQERRRKIDSTMNVPAMGKCTR